MVRPRNIGCIVGARPNFVKIAPLLRELDSIPEVRAVLIHTGQHYDTAMSDVFFSDLGIRAPDEHLEVGSGTHAEQTARLLERFEKVVVHGRSSGCPLDHLVVVGDVNSTMACALVAAKEGVTISHVEAGLRSGDRTMPEEINRIITDSIANVFFVTEPDGMTNLLREGHDTSAIHLVGNLMIDTLTACVDRARALNMPRAFGVQPRKYGVVTVHRPSNTDAPAVLAALVDCLVIISARLPLVFPLHPRTRGQLERCGLLSRLLECSNIRTTTPVGYFEFLGLTSESQLIITDSGGLQEESTALGVPCLTLRENTERPITVTEGTSVLVGNDWSLLHTYVQAVLDGSYKKGRCPEIWDGRAAQRIVGVLANTVWSL